MKRFRRRPGRRFLRNLGSKFAAWFVAASVRAYQKRNMKYEG